MSYVKIDLYLDFHVACKADFSHPCGCLCQFGLRYCTFNIGRANVQNSLGMLGCLGDPRIH